MSVDQLGNRLLRAMVTAPLGGQPAWLLGGDAQRVCIATPAGEIVSMVSDLTRVPEELAKHKRGMMHVVLVGGGPGHRRALTKLWPFWQFSRQLAFHHVDDNSGYHTVKGKRLPLVAHAANVAPSLEPLSPEEAAPLIDAARVTVDAEKHFTLRAGLPWASIAIAAACVLTFILQEIWGGSQSLAGLVRMGANQGDLLHAPWTLLTSAFLHIGPEHLILNMAALFSFGHILERALGVRRYLLLYFSSALGGGLLSAVGHPTPVVSAGASGALWGLMVAGGVLVTWPNGLLPPLLAGRARRKVWQPVVLNGLYSMQPGIDWLCHLGGGLVGGALMALMVWRLAGPGTAPSPSSRRRLLAVLASIACVTGSFAAAWAKGHPWELGKPPALERRFIGVMGLSIEVPRDFATNREDDAVAFGDLEHDPIAVEVRFEVAEKLRSPRELDEARAKLPDLLAKHAPEGVTVIGAPRMELIGSLPTCVVDGKYENGNTTRTWAVSLPDGLAVVRVYVMSNAPGPWQALRDTFIRTLRTTGGQVD